jgi:hypothetical protein
MLARQVQADTRLGIAPSAVVVLPLASFLLEETDAGIDKLGWRGLSQDLLYDESERQQRH